MIKLVITVLEVFQVLYPVLAIITVCLLASARLLIFNSLYRICLEDAISEIHLLLQNEAKILYI